jgi:hypothetical protein
MLRLKFRHLIVLTFFVPYILGSKGCGDNKTDTPSAPEPCGIGEGQYEFSLVNTVPETFDCNDSGRFVITIRPKIDPSYSGTSGVIFNRLYFVLDDTDDPYICWTNYVEFLSGNTADQQLEWGGSVPTGNYKVRGRMQNIQLNSDCPDSVRELCYKDLGEIDITEFSNPQKVMEIEYFCQDSDTNVILRYDVFLSPNTEKYMDIAFNIANTRCNVDIYQTDLPDSLILHTAEGVIDYIYTYKQLGDEMFLCGIKGFRDEQGEFLDTILGTTYLMYDFAPTCSTGSLVAVKACIDFAGPRYKLDYNNLITAAVIHELGHQRAIYPGHVPGSGPRFCIMNEAVIINPPHPYDAVTFANPHFCEECINKIKNANW